MSKPKTTYQDFVIRQLLSIFSLYTIEEIKNNQGFKAVIERMIRWYPEITATGKKTYQQLPAYKTCFKATTKAFDILTTATSYQGLSMEHTPGVTAVVNEIINLATQHTIPQIEHLHLILDGYEVIIMTPSQCSLINKSRFKSAGSLEERLKLIGDIIEPETEQNSLFKV